MGHFACSNTCSWREGPVIDCIFEERRFQFTLQQIKFLKSGGGQEGCERISWDPRQPLPSRAEKTGLGGPMPTLQDKPASALQWGVCATQDVVTPLCVPQPKLPKEMVRKGKSTKGSRVSCSVLWKQLSISSHTVSVIRAYCQGASR